MADRIAGLVLAVLMLLSAGCTTIRPVTVPVPAAPEAKAPFSHAELDAVLARFVDERGRVDYSGLARSPDGLERYYALLAAISPESDPALFPTRQDKLAYWINAYNASVLVIVLRHYPISSVMQVSSFPLSLVSDKIGFFVLQRIELGGETTNLYTLENFVVRRRYDDPRVHFALNCAARGCPRLPRHAFTGAALDEQLDHEARRFFAERRNLDVDHLAKKVYLSSILDWYEDDFTDWYEENHPGGEPTLLAYAALYVPPERAEELRAAAGYDTEFIPYDWMLNDQAP